ncbi:hypothetical protein FACS189430_02020 [Bacteroidia bacterium]|nr:hypothetical protein FACS189430_02020 [Bacteroidia bacterium]
MENPENQLKNNSSNEIDLFEFCSRLWDVFISFLIKFKDFIISIILFLIRKSLWVVSFALFGGVIGYALYFTTIPVYSSYLVAETGQIKSEVFIDHVNRLSKLKANSDALSKYLKINAEDAAKISSIKAYYGIDVNKDRGVDYVDFKESYNPKDTSQARVANYLYLRVAVYDEDIFPKLRSGLLHYINDNAYIKMLFEINMQQKGALISELNAEIAKIDSLQHYQMKQDKANLKDILLTSKPDIKLFYSDLLSLYRQKQDLERDTAVFKAPIAIIQNFTPLSLEDRPKSLFAAVAGAIGAVLGLVFALLWQYRKRIWSLIIEKR